MEKIKALAHSLKGQKSKDEVVSILQQINDLIITEYMIELKNGVRMYPIEVESYFYEDKVFADPYTHGNEMQKNRFGKLYFHRFGDFKTGTFKSRNPRRGGVDICLSDDEGFYLGVLIRAAKFGLAELRIGTRRVLDQLISGFNLGTDMEKEDKLIELEEESCLKRAMDDPRKHAPIKLPLIELPAIAHLSRVVELNNKDYCSEKYIDYDLRSLIEFNENTYVGGQKKVVKKYFDDHASLGKEAAKRIAKELFGLVPNWLNKYIDNEFYVIEKKQI